MWPISSDLVPGGYRRDNSEYCSWNPEILHFYLFFHKDTKNWIIAFGSTLGTQKLTWGIGQYLYIQVLKYEFNIPIFRHCLNFIYFPTNNWILALGFALGTQKNCMGIGQYLHIHVPEYQLDILIFRYFLNFSLVKPHKIQ